MTTSSLPASLAATLDWKLLKGSHKFPGPEGGTCINEAAVVAAGFEYRTVNSWRDCPPCFSPIVAQLGIALNDRLNDEDRQVLLPFVMRMAGTKGTPEVERQRAEWLVRQIVNVDLAVMCEVMGKADLASMVREAVTLTQCKEVALKIKAADAAAYAAAAAAAAAAAKFKFSISNNNTLIPFKDRAVQLLDGLINIYRQPTDEIAVEVAVERLRKVREKRTAVAA